MADRQLGLLLPWLTFSFRKLVSYLSCYIIFITDVLCCFDLVIDCGALSTPTNGLQTPTGSLVDDTASFSCVYGYRLEGSATRTCQTDETWTGTAPTCVRKLLFVIKLIIGRSIFAMTVQWA